MRVSTRVDARGVREYRDGEREVGYPCERGGSGTGQCGPDSSTEQKERREEGRVGVCQGVRGTSGAVWLTAAAFES